MSDKEFSRSAIIRRMILENPEITLDQLRDDYEGPDTVPNKVHILYQEKSNIRRKLDIDDLDALPQHNGKFNTSGFLREFCTDMQSGEAIKFCEYFGLEVSSTLASQVLGSNGKKKAPETDDFEPDENQGTGPRARKKGKPGRKPAGEKKQPKKPASTATYEGIETSLDDLIQKASTLNDPSLAETLKTARRQAGASILRAN